MADQILDHPITDDDTTEAQALAALTAVEERALLVRKQLRAQIGPIFTLPGRSAASYHTGEQVIAWLNEVLGEENWTTRILDRWREDDSDEVCVSLELEATFWVPDPNAPETAIRRTVTHQDFGSQQIKRTKAGIDQDGNPTGSIPLSIGDDYKSAATDAIKRCAKLLSVGLYLWEKAPTIPYRRSEEEEAARAALAARPTGRPALPQPTPQPAPTDAPEDAPSDEAPKPGSAYDRAALVQRYQDALSLATASGFKAAWTTTHIALLTNDKIIEYGKQLGAHNKRVAEREPAMDGAA